MVRPRAHLAGASQHGGAVPVHRARGPSACRRSHPQLRGARPAHRTLPAAGRRPRPARWVARPALRQSPRGLVGAGAHGRRRPRDRGQSLPVDGRRRTARERRRWGAPDSRRGEDDGRVVRGQGDLHGHGHHAHRVAARHRSQHGDLRRCRGRFLLAARPIPCGAARCRHVRAPGVPLSGRAGCRDLPRGASLHAESPSARLGAGPDGRVHVDAVQRGLHRAARFRSRSACLAWRLARRGRLPGKPGGVDQRAFGAAWRRRCGPHAASQCCHHGRLRAHGACHRGHAAHARPGRLAPAGGCPGRRAARGYGGARPRAACARSTLRLPWVSSTRRTTSAWRPYSPWRACSAISPPAPRRPSSSPPA